MRLNWNEIKSRALLFSKTWADASNEDSEAKPFWIELYQRITSLLPASYAKKTRKQDQQKVDRHLYRSFCGITFTLPIRGTYETCNPFLVSCRYRRI